MIRFPRALLLGGLLVVGLLLADRASVVHAGVSLGGGGGASQPFCFALSTTPPAAPGMLTTAPFGIDITVGDGPIPDDRFQILQLLHPQGFGGGFGGGGGGGAFGGFSGAFSGATGSAHGSGVTDGNSPVTGCYVWFFDDDPSDDDGPANATDGTFGQDGSDPGPPGGPSVVPEPGSFGLWAALVIALIGATRRPFRSTPR